MPCLRCWLRASAPGPGPDPGVGALVPARSLFVPREMLTVPEYYGVHENVEWHLAQGATDAAHLAGAREQHELAYAI